MFTLQSIDKVANMWQGNDAYTNWGLSNQLWRGTRGNINSYTAYFTAGQLVPIKLLWANGPQTGCLQLGITDLTGLHYNSTAGLFKWPNCAVDNLSQYPIVAP
ncbi:MAG: hypothetical protein EOO38_29990, partial [Cytophagaceae bacterium]